MILDISWKSLLKCFIDIISMKNNKEVYNIKKYRFVDITTSDVAFVAYGRSLGELFSNSALATFEVMINIDRVKNKVKREIDLSGHDLSSLMFSWLNELLVYPDSENLVFSKFSVRVDEKKLKLKAKCYGEKIDRKRHELGTVVKSCTYHKMEITKKRNIWQAQVILDI